MATVTAIAQKRDSAIARIIASANCLGDQFELDRLEIPSQGRDLNYLAAQRLEAIAEWLETLVNKAIEPAKTVKAVPIKVKRAPARRRAK